MAAVGVTVHTRASDAKAAHCEAGAKGERATAVLLAPLEAAGWVVLHDRALPGARSANADHIVISPAARVYVIDSKLWAAKNRHGRAAVVHARDGRLWHGDRYADQAISSLLFEASLVEGALGVPVQPLVCMHNASVEGGRFWIRQVAVLPGESLVQLLVFNDGARHPAAGGLGVRARQLFLPYG
ncbi:nuclease-related domain-containing protein [Streptomyces griseorubiginosus]|uniref:nuclease-related domain-containing protein n=1 Tax=Streptomyces griseorubiginosus TaxID=67304 RepID=UPI003331C222